MVGRFFDSMYVASTDKRVVIIMPQQKPTKTETKPRSNAEPNSTD